MMFRIDTIKIPKNDHANRAAAAEANRAEANRAEANRAAAAEALVEMSKFAIVYVK
jgi:hypothetical protein